MTMEDDLARYVAGITYESIDQETLHVLKRNILDSYASICGSMYDTGMLGQFDTMVDISAGDGSVDVWGIGRQSGIGDAIFMNTILGRRSDLLNTYFSPNSMGVSHPSDNVSLALTLAGWLGKSGKDLLTMVYVGYMLAGIFSNYYFPESAEYDHDAGAVFYTTLLIGHAIGLSQQQLVEAQRIAGGFGLDTNQSARNEMTDWKHCTYASCAIRGIVAVKMAKAGFAGPYEIYEGDAGVNRFFPHTDTLFDPVPDLSSIVFKRWPALVFCQTPIDTALDLAPEILDPATIDTVEVQTYQMAANLSGGEAAYHADSRAGRTHSMPYCVAAVLLTGQLKYSDFDPPFSDNSDLSTLLAKTKIVEDPDITAAFPAKSPCSIIVTLRDGTTIERERDVPRGDPQDPLSDDELEAKLAEYFFFASDKTEIDTLARRLWALETEQSTGWLLNPLKQRRL